MYCQDIYYGVFDAYKSKLTRIMYFLCPKNRLVVQKISFPVNFRFISGGISAEKNFGKFVLHQKIRLWISRGVSRTSFELLYLSTKVPPLSAFKKILAVYCLLVPWLLNLTIPQNIRSSKTENIRSFNRFSKLCGLVFSRVYRPPDTSYGSVRYDIQNYDWFVDF